MQSFDIHLLRSFVAVSRTGSISGAALQVGRTQSAVSMQMRRLESLVGHPILHRSGGGVDLTAAGDRLLASAQRILNTHDEELAQFSGSGLRGVIIFGCPEEYLVAFIPDILKGFTTNNSDIEIEVICSSTVKLFTLLHRRRIDLALVSVPLDSAHNEAVRLESFVWVANDPHPTILEDEILPLALSAPDTLDHRAARNAMERAGRLYRVSFASNSLAGLLAFTRSGQAISVVTRSAVPDDLHIIQSPMPQLPDIGISIVYSSSRPSAAVSGFGEYMRDRLPQALPF